MWEIDFMKISRNFEDNMVTLLIARSNLELTAWIR